MCLVFDFAHAFVTLCFIVMDAIKNISNLNLNSKHLDCYLLSQHRNEDHQVSATTNLRAYGHVIMLGD